MHLLNTLMKKLHRNDGRSTKSAYKFMVIILLLAIELKAATNGNSTNDL